jgi:hypothetical protein
MFATSQLYPSPILRILLSFSFLKNNLKQADKLFCELEDFYANFGVSITAT